MKQVWISCNHHAMRSLSHMKRPYVVLVCSYRRGLGKQPTPTTRSTWTPQAVSSPSPANQSHHWVLPETLNAKWCYSCAVLFKFLIHRIFAHHKMVTFCTKIAVICHEAIVVWILLTINLTFPIIKKKTYIHRYTEENNRMYGERFRNVNNYIHLPNFIDCYI